MQRTPSTPIRASAPLLRTLARGAALLAALGSAPALAATGAAQVELLTGVMVAQRAAGRLHLLAPQSTVQVGDTLVTEEDSYARIVLPGGRTATLGPGTRLTVASPERLALAVGALEVRGAPGAATPLAVTVAGNSIDASQASFIVQYVSEHAGSAAQAQRAYARAAMAAATSPTQLDVGSPQPVWVLAQGVVPVQRPQPPAALGVPRPGTPPLSPGLHLFVTNGAIVMSNSGGAQNFTAGQFGFVPSNRQTPLLVPNNPGLIFTPPPQFAVNISNLSTGQNNNNQSSPQAIACEVR